MPMRVVDQLEAIEIQAKQGEALSGERALTIALRNRSRASSGSTAASSRRNEHEAQPFLGHFLEQHRPDHIAQRTRCPRPPDPVRPDQHAVNASEMPKRCC